MSCKDYFLSFLELLQSPSTHNSASPHPLVLFQRVWTLFKITRTCALCSNIYILISGEELHVWSNIRMSNWYIFFYLILGTIPLNTATRFFLSGNLVQMPNQLMFNNTRFTLLSTRRDRTLPPKRSIPQLHNDATQRVACWCNVWCVMHPS